MAIIFRVEMVWWLWLLENHFRVLLRATIGFMTEDQDKNLSNYIMHHSLPAPPSPIQLKGDQRKPCLASNLEAVEAYVF